MTLLLIGALFAPYVLYPAIAWTIMQLIEWSQDRATVRRYRKAPH